MWDEKRRGREDDRVVFSFYSLYYYISKYLYLYLYLHLYRYILQVPCLYLITGAEWEGTSLYMVDIYSDKQTQRLFLFILFSL